jgi:hypothetical protein
VGAGVKSPGSGSGSGAGSVEPLPQPLPQSRLFDFIGDGHLPA